MTTNTTHWVAEAARIEKTEQSGWCAYLDIVDEGGRCIEAVNICRGISSRESAEALVNNWVRALAAPAQAVVPADHSGDNFGSAEHWKEKAQYWAGVAHRMRQEALRGEPVDGIVPVHPAVPAQAGEYPELPAPLVLESGYGPGDVPDAYTADQMRAYADATCAARGAAQAAPVDAAKLPSPANVGTAPKCLNLNDQAIWALGWNECLDAARAAQEGK